MADPAGGGEAVFRICHAGVEMLPVDGASISAVRDGAERETLYATDEIIARVESLQFTLGEGPCHEACASRRPVLVPDLSIAPQTRWPVFVSEIDGLPIGAIYAFPIQYGAVDIGVLDLYRRHIGWLTDTELNTALQIVDLAAGALLGAQSETVHDTDGRGLKVWLAPLPRNRAEIHQATGILVAALGIPAEQALARLRSYAFTTDSVVEDIANDIVNRRTEPVVFDT
ncbi:GAF and ANTAR domain-containing protein [Sciscionella marina]|uniref:GAF and ANTAR domain-containing protein n=1 Tax=Sciscionella marina TaxID=508770 RepID=UPI0003817A8A|nr:GAF and ANTAR domain-containing protein [Sciscionella marina]